MNKITEIHLNGKAFKLEEAGYQALQHYLKDAEAKLASDPDAKEIVTDLEQAIADKCSALLKGDKDVVTSEEILAILKDMGEVEAEYAPTADPAEGDTTSGQQPGSQQKRLYTIRDGAMLAGVCKGLAAYFGLEANTLRWIFVILTLFTGGTIIVAYIVLALFLPRATTSAQIAEAYGRPVTAQEIVENGKERLAEVSGRMRNNSDPKFLRIVINIGIIVVVVYLVFLIVHVFFNGLFWHW